MALRKNDNDLIEGVEEPFSFVEEPELNDRKRYTAQLQRRAQAHITAELGGAAQPGPDIDRQVTMVVQRTRDITGARRVSLFRPVARGRRWHVATMLGDGTFYYGLAAPETLRWPRVAFDQKRPFLVNDGEHVPVSGPGAIDLGMSSYVSVPIMSGNRAVAVMDAVDVNDTADLTYYSAQMEQAVSSLADGLDEGGGEGEEHSNPASGNAHDLVPESIVDLVLRQPYDVDEAFEITPSEWALIAQTNGERSIKLLAETTAMPVGQVVSIASTLIERGLLRIGKENRRHL
ncbi:MAG TPA: GAF domain-containing protein [Thermomicrobiales bacterium]|nr:GAF domain-containing protein [Thermomicrobiales bacterium]